MTSDEAIAMMVFAGLAGGRLRKVDPKLDKPISHSSVTTRATASPSNDSSSYWAADFSELVTLETRPDYERFGATAYFSREQKLVRIRWSQYALDVYPGDRQWAHAKWVWRCSALVGVYLKVLGMFFECLSLSKFFWLCRTSWLSQSSVSQVSEVSG